MMRTLRDLTQAECIEIASIAEPKIRWKLIQSSNVWDGFDLIENDCEVEGKAVFIFQIDYRADEIIGSNPRFRIYENLHEYAINVDAIHRYLTSIGCQPF